MQFRALYAVTLIVAAVGLVACGGGGGGGDTTATESTGESSPETGASGGNEETGLYFELRHLGRPFDPLRWVKLK